MNKNKRIAPNVIRGGVAIPLKSNYFLMKGRTHQEGGIDVGKDLEVEDGEIMKITKNNIKVLSDQPIFNGISPAEYAINGNIRKRFEKAFRAQEKYKNINGLNDDGTKKAKYGTNKKSIGGDENNSNINLGEVPGVLYKGNVKEKSLYDKAVPNSPLRPVNDNFSFKEITEDITNSKGYLYNNRDYYKFYKDANNKFYLHNTRYNRDTGVINPDNFIEVPYKEIRGMLGARDYIGGSKKDVGLKVLDKLTGINDYITQLSNTYGISSDVFKQRLINEGLLQMIAEDYNNIGPNEQKSYSWQDWIDNEINGYHSLGLDTFGSHLNKGDLNLRRNIDWHPMEIQNEDGTNNTYISASFNNLYDALEAKAAMLEYFTNIAKKRNISEEDMDAYVNAMYNMGENNDDLKNMDYVRKQYSVDKYFKLGGRMSIKNVSSTGKKTKAELGEVMKVDEHGNLIADIEPAVVTARKPLNEIVQSELVRRILLDKIKLFDDKKIPTYKIKSSINKKYAKLGTEEPIKLKEVVVIDTKKEMPKITAKATTKDPGIIKVENSNNKPKVLPKLDSSLLTKKAIVGPLKLNKDNKEKVIELPEVIVQDTKKPMPDIKSKATTKDPGIIIPKRRNNQKKISNIDSSVFDEKAKSLKSNGIIYVKKDTNKRIENIDSSKLLNNEIKAKSNNEVQLASYKKDKTINDNKDKVYYLEANPTFLPNLIGAGINVIGSGISYGINKKFLNELKAPKAPYLLQPTKLKTRINIKPQVNELKRTINRYNKYFDKNTASSQTAVGRRLLNEQTYIDNYNQLYGAKENQETQLINQDRLQQHETAKYNLTNYNNWLREKTNFENSVREKKSENAQMLTQNIAGSLTNFLDKQAQWKESMANIAALSAAYPDVTPEYMAEQGLPYALWLKQKRERKNNR